MTCFRCAGVSTAHLTLKINSHLVHSAHEFDHEHAETECEEGELSPEAAWEVVEEVEGDADFGNVIAPGAGRVGVFELEWHGRGGAVFSNHAFAAFGHGGAFGVVREAAAGETNVVYVEVEEHACSDGNDATAGINVVKPFQVGGGVGEFFFVLSAGEPPRPHVYDVGEVEVVDGAVVAAQVLGEAVQAAADVHHGGTGVFVEVAGNF